MSRAYATVRASAPAPGAEWLESYRLLSLVWVLGASLSAAITLAVNFRFWKATRHGSPPEAPHILRVLDECRQQMAVRTRLRPVVTDRVTLPVVFGLIRPSLLLPPGLSTMLSLDQLRYVFLHDLAHLKRRDLLQGWAMKLVWVLHWLNPLVWLAVRYMRRDRELACDAMVLNRIEPDECRDYGRTIVRLLEQRSRPQRLAVLAGILDTKAHLKERVAMAANHRKQSRSRSILAASLLIGLVAVGLTDASSQKDVPRRLTRRQDSVAAGLAALGEPYDVALVHDAARPFPDPADIDRLAREVQRAGGGLLAMRSPDTVKRAGPTGRVTQTLDRAAIWLAQTPQAIRADLVPRAIEALRAEETVTDEATLLEQWGVEVVLVESSARNFKITHERDLAWAEAWLAANENHR